MTLARGKPGIPIRRVEYMRMSSRTGQEPPVLNVHSAPSFESFYQREFPAIRAVAWTLTGNVSTAEDVAQDAFLRAHRDWDRISGYDEPGAWVRRVAINLATHGCAADYARYEPWVGSPVVEPTTGTCQSRRASSGQPSARCRANKPPYSHCTTRIFR
jgi:Sigma-70 region 2